MQTTLMTGDHTTTGTPAFMAPEIILGEATSTGAPTSTRSAASPTTC